MKKLFLASLITSVFYFFPFLAIANMKINEIAWMGTSVSANNEWIELKNDGSDIVDISGWRLEWNDGKSGINFGVEKCANTKISASNFLLLERTSDETVSGISADCVYTGALSNSGELLILKDVSGMEIDRVDGKDAWKLSGSSEAIGNNTTKETAQLSSSDWITATGTPKAVNASKSTLNNSDPDTTTTEDTAEQTQNSGGTPPVVSYSYSAHSSPFELSNSAPRIKASLISGRDRVVLSDSLVPFSARLVDKFGDIMDGGNYGWSFGDGSASSGKDIGHTYELPGEYVVILKTIFNGQEYLSRENIKVVSPDFEVETVAKDGVYFIQIANRLSSEVNLKDWQLRSGFRTFIFGADTIILANKKVSLSPKIIGIELKDEDSVDLLSPLGKVLAKNDVLSKEVSDSTINYQNDILSAEDSPDDTLIVEDMRRELLLLEEKLRRLQSSLVANISSAEEISDQVEPFVYNDGAIATTTYNEEAARSSSTVIVLSPDINSKGSGLWKFFKNLIYR